MESVENQKAGFPLFPPPLEIRKSSGFPHFHSYYGGGGGGLEASPNPQRPKVGQIKPPKWAKRSCQTHAGLPLRAPDAARILIVSDDDSDTEELKIVFQKAGLTSESAVSIAAGCESAISGRLQVVFSTPV
ncbi:MAG TPA: hypothetical protein VEO53_02890, partial [Candidatus Binatia bacterium]|nr:hypothetical protein [Candidatus Binatia bacterium]